MAVRFDASTDAYTASNGAPGGTVYSGTLWAYITTDRNTDSTVLQLRTSTGGANAYYLGTGADGTSMFMSENTGSAGPFAMTVGTWAALGFVVNGTSIALYAGNAGAALTKFTATAGATVTPTQLVLGSDEFGGWFNGRVAAVKMWAAALTDTEIANELAQYQPLRTANLLRYHPLLRAELVDYSGLARTLTAGTTSTTTEDGPGLPWGMSSTSRQAATGPPVPAVAATTYASAQVSAATGTSTSAAAAPVVTGSVSAAAVSPIASATSAGTATVTSTAAASTALAVSRATTATVTATAGTGLAALPITTATAAPTANTSSPAAASRATTPVVVATASAPNGSALAAVTAGAVAAATASSPTSASRTTTAQVVAAANVSSPATATAPATVTVAATARAPSPITGYRTVIRPQTPTEDAPIAPALVAVDTLNGMYAPNAGRSVLIFRNTGPIPVSALLQFAPQPDPDDDPDVPGHETVAIPNGGVEVWTSTLPADLFCQPNGQLIIDFTSAVGVTVAAVEVYPRW